MPTPARTHDCTWSPITREDLPELANLVAAVEHLGEPTHHHDLTGLEQALDDPQADLGHNSVVLRKPSGTLIAYAWLRMPGRDDRSGRVYLSGGVHPGWRHEGIQPTLVCWLRERAQEWHAATADGREPLELVMFLSTATPLLGDVLRQHGFVPQRWYHALRCGLNAQLPAEFAGVDLAAFEPAWSDPVRRLHNAALIDPRDALDADAWRWRLAGSGVRDELSWVALEGGVPVGWVLNAETVLGGERAGWTEYLGAVPDWRNRGLFRALLGRSQAGFGERGLHLAGIGVETESDQGARPYLELGYELMDTVAWYVHHPPVDRIVPAPGQDRTDGT